MLKTIEKINGQLVINVDEIIKEVKKDVIQENYTINKHVKIIKKKTDLHGEIAL